MKRNKTPDAPVPGPAAATTAGQTTAGDAKEGPQPGKVFCIGHNKTGTKSLKAALEDLGYVFGDQTVAARLAPETWPQRDFRPIVEYCRSAQAFQDAPFSFPFTFQAMDAAFPGSKFILTVRRSAEAWYESLVRFHGKLYANGRVPPTKADLQQASVWQYKGRPWQMNRMLFDSPEEQPYEKQALLRYYENHIYSVREYFRHRPKDLLILDVSEDGAFQKLCRLLDRPEQNRKFPHLNRT